LYLELRIERDIDKWEAKMRRWLSVVVKFIFNAFAHSEKNFEAWGAETLKI